MEQYQFGMDLEKIVTFLQRFSLATFIFCMDSASSNFVFIRKFLSFIHQAEEVRRDRAEGPRLSSWIQPCDLHKIARINVKVTKRLKINQVVSVFAFYLNKRTCREDFRRAFLKEVKESFKEDTLPPPADVNLDAHRQQLRRLLCRPAVADPAQLWGSCPDFEKLFDYMFEGRNIFSKSLGHLCTAACHCRASSGRRCPDQRYILAHVKKLLEAGVFCVVPVKFNQGRWRKSIPMCRYVLRLLLMGNLVVKAIEVHLKKLKDNKLGKRLTWLVGALKHPMVVAQCVVGLISLNYLEEIMDLIYNDSTVSTDSRDQHSDRQRKKQDKRDGASAARRCVDKVADVKGRVWQSFKDDQATSVWALAIGFAPDDHQNDVHGVIMQAVFTVLGDIDTRFANHKSFPLCLTSIEHLPENHPEWANKARVLVNHRSPCCLFPLCQTWKERLRLEGDERHRGVLLSRLYWTFVSSLRMSTLMEENWHSFLKDWNWKPAQKYTRIATLKVNEHIRRVWSVRGGRCLSKPPPNVTKAFRLAARGKVLPKSKRTVYHRHNRPVTDAMAAFHYKNRVARQGCPENADLKGHALRERKQELFKEFMGWPQHEKIRHPVNMFVVGNVFDLQPTSWVSGDSLVLQIELLLLWQSNISSNLLAIQ